MTPTSSAAPLPYEPDFATPPGYTLEELLEELDMSQAELARRAELSKKHVNQIIQGKVAISPEVAMKLELVTGTPARLWNNLEARYQEHKLRLSHSAQIANDVPMLDLLPVASMVSLGLLTKRASGPQRIREVLEFFGVASSDAWTEIWSGNSALYRKSGAFESDDGALAVWLRLGELAAREVACAPWSSEGFREVLDAARGLTQDPEPSSWWPKLVGLCAGVGVALVVVPQVKGARTNGAARWLSADRALIQLSLRHRWSDIFWFTFFHEAKHILDQKKRSIFVEPDRQVEGRADVEIEADRFAANFLIPEKHVHRLPFLRSLEDVKVFAEDVGVHPGIVVGRLQHDEIWPRSHGNGLRQRLVLSASDD